MEEESDERGRRRGSNRLRFLFASILSKRYRVQKGTLS